MCQPAKRKRKHYIIRTKLDKFAHSSIKMIFFCFSHLDDYSNRQRSHSFSGRPAHKLQRRGVLAYTMPPARSPSLLEHTLADVIDLTESASKMSTPSSFGTTFLTPPGSTDHGSFKSPESGTPEWLLNADVPPHCYVTTAMESEEGGVAYKPQPHSVSRSSSFRTPII